MTTTLIFLLLMAAGIALWSAARDASDVARSHARALCERNGVQLLDQSVALVSFRLRRDDNGRMRWQRTYQYAYSIDGSDRATGQIALLGTRLLWSSEP